MSSGNLAPLLGLFWIAGCAASFFWLWRRGAARLPSLLFAVLVAASVRVVPALLLPRGAAYEMFVFRQAATLIRAGDNVYLSDVAHPYLPLLVYWMGAASWLAEHVGLFFVFWFKLISIVADVAIVMLICAGTLLLGRGSDTARWSAWLYAVNPITILVVAYQGQFDALPLLFLLVSWYTLTRDTDRHLVLSALALGVAVLSKTWPVIFLPIVLLRLRSWRSRIAYGILCALVPLVAVFAYELLFPGSLAPLLRRASRAGAIAGWWGYSAPLNVFVTLTERGAAVYDWVTEIGKRASLLFAVLTIFATRRLPAHRSLLLTVLVLFVTVPNLGLQSLSWLLPLGLLAAAPVPLAWFAGGALVHMIISYWGLHLSTLLLEPVAAPWRAIIIQLSSLLVWFPLLAWLWTELLALRRPVVAVGSHDPVDVC